MVSLFPYIWYYFVGVIVRMWKSWLTCNVAITYLLALWKTSSSGQSGFFSCTFLAITLCHRNHKMPKARRAGFWLLLGSPRTVKHHFGVLWRVSYGLSIKLDGSKSIRIAFLGMKLHLSLESFSLTSSLVFLFSLLIPTQWHPLQRILMKPLEFLVVVPRN